MPYIALETLTESREYVEENVKKPDTFAGLILYLLCVCDVERDGTYLKSNMKEFSEYADRAFCLSPNESSYSEKFWYAALTSDWQERVRYFFLQGQKISLKHIMYSIFWYKKLNEIYEVLEKLPKSFINEAFIEDINEEDFISTKPISKQDLLIHYSNTNSDSLTIKFDNTFVKKRAGDLSGAPFGQTLYAGTEIKRIISVFDFDFFQHYNLFVKESAVEKNVSEPVSSYRIDDKKGRNILLYGAPGVGKSHLIETQYCNDLNKIERIVFHPDYMNTDFIGQILPDVNNGAISYDFKAGAFTRILKKAIENAGKHYYLIIEEINRGNAPAIFGEIFQLLDRDSDGVSKYAISNQDIAKQVYDDVERKIIIPANLTILATMNTADQNVFTLDTAFQRRWQMQMMENNIEKCNFKDTKILDTSVTWGVFNTVINQHILDNNSLMLSSEDKRLGAYFISEDVLTQELSAQTDHIFFSEKILKYLWDDVYKFNREQLFDGRYQSLEQVINDFSSNKTAKRFTVFNQEVAIKLIGINVAEQESPLDE
ncbi:McrB family protein [Psychrobacter sp. 72-O-c]|uniref:McrB family protein n=1 Tax=Psychrobacter sp. 72-O-c TaxID=2774125 RepID=UPI00191ACD1E|nr:AAA family ATPase [Psychrobacter sp. 72-O-c]